MKLPLLLSFLLFHSCASAPAPIVTPTGPATRAQDGAITDHLGKLDQTSVAVANTLSKVSAAAGVIREVNQGQPAGPRSVGVDNEGALIQTLAGPPSDQDRAAAAERAKIVAAGKPDDIAKAYAAANAAAITAQSKLAESVATLTASNATLLKAKDAAAAEQATLTGKLQARIDGMQRDADDRVKAALEKGAADQRKLITWIFFGGGAALLAGGIAIIFLAGSVPIFGPKAGMGVMAAGAGLIAIGIAMNELAKHPWVIWVGISLCLMSLAGALGLMIANHFHFNVVGKLEDDLDSLKKVALPRPTTAAQA